jgi:hypothetical protein
MAHRCYGPADAAYLSCLEAERIGFTSTPAAYYSLRRAVNVDALYAEPARDPLYGGPTTVAGTVWGWRAPFDLEVTIEYGEPDNREPSVREEGTTVDYDATIRLAGLTWTAAAPAGVLPKEGDVLTVFGHHWDVVKASAAGHVWDTPTTVGWSLNVKRREEFAPERKLP